MDVKQSVGVQFEESDECVLVWTLHTVKCSFKAETQNQWKTLTIKATLD